MGKHSRKLPNDERTDRANFLLLENDFKHETCRKSLFQISDNPKNGQ